MEVLESLIQNEEINEGPMNLSCHVRKDGEILLGLI